MAVEIIQYNVSFTPQGLGVCGNIQFIKVTFYITQYDQAINTTIGQINQIHFLSTLKVKISKFKSEQKVQGQSL